MSEAPVLQHDEITQVLANQIEAGIEKINKANETLLAEDESGTGVRDIDKAFKDGKVEDADAKKAWEKAEKAKETYKKSLEAARNAYRVNVLGEEEKEDVDTSELKDATKEVRNLVMQAVSLLKTVASANSKADVLKWAESLEIPQVGRQGSSNVGQKKPRAYVTVNGTTHNTFGEAAKAASELLSTEDNKVEVTSGELTQAYLSNGEKENFEFNGLAVRVVPKEKASAAA